CLQDVQLPLTF
nr:immunoglobulin light chain junction region [Macaca mulatta]MOV80754.1 immunoglobulin light chain junction region [Macaca mulatta]MOW41356.1 immunoglobulin light chain junction region [Macaca mulatta]MOW42060.1 immunoglobulin light chain junction region [Macaca mulatta]MOW44498.1 immunoglobulin light chain junction region [Macaca mulatta]